MSESKKFDSRVSSALVGPIAALAVLTACSHGEKTPPPTDHGAGKISTELYDSKDFPNGVPVPGVLNGSVVVVDKAGSVTWNNPVLLDRDKGNSLEGAWLGIPSQNQDGHTYLQPVQIHPGKHNGETETLQLHDPANPVLYGAAIYKTSVTNGPDEVIAFDIQGNGNFPSVPVSVSGTK